MKLDELRERWMRISRALQRELRWREKRYPVGHAERDQEVGEVKVLIADVVALKDALKRRLGEEVESMQPTLLDVPKQAKYE